jgi:hypothetical protein
MSVEIPFQSEWHVSTELEEQLKRVEDLKPSTQEIEESQARHEDNVERVRQFRLDNQEDFTDEKERLINILDVVSFTKKLESIPNLHVYYTDAGVPGQLGLFVYMRGEQRRPFRDDLPLGVKYICFVQPVMPEWSVLNIDGHEVAHNEKYRGWRTVLVKLIQEGAITEQEAHEAFGRPAETRVSQHYHKHLFNLRNYGHI